MNPVRDNVRSFLLLTSYFLLLTSFLAPVPTHAHKVQMFAHAEGDRVFVEGYFPDGKKTINSEVIVYDSKSGEKLLRGKTDDNGKFSFKAPRKTDLRITLNASLGHKTEYTLPGSDLPEIDGNKALTSAAKALNPGDKNVIPAEAGIQTSSLRKQGTIKSLDSHFRGNDVMEAGFSEENVQAIVERGVEKGVSPLIREFSECKEHVFFSEIIGGIGYIFGVLGIFLYFKSRKSQQ